MRTAHLHVGKAQIQAESGVGNLRQRVLHGGDFDEEEVEVDIDPCLDGVMARFWTDVDSVEPTRSGFLLDDVVNSRRVPDALGRPLRCEGF